MTPHPLNIQVPVELETPCIFAIDTIDFAATLAQAFYNDPSQRLLTFGITGSRGKTTVAWLLRSVLEHAGKLTGMICSVEWAIATDRLDLRGELWEPDEEDPTLKRECSAPYKAVPWQGKYDLPCTTPDHISVRSMPCWHSALFSNCSCMRRLSGADCAAPRRRLPCVLNIATDAACLC
jgi:hypothetical protein